VSALRSPSAPALEAPRLGRGDLHVWRIDLAGPPSDGAMQALDTAERERAAAFRFPLHRDRFVRGRHALRRVLAAYLGTRAEAVALASGPHGKPQLAGDSPIGFNLSHSGDVALLAVGDAAHIGIDVEEMAPRKGLRELARTVFDADEMRWLDRLDDAAFARGFHALWTRKEACLKALGVGLVLDPKQLHVGAASTAALVTMPNARAAVRVQNIPVDAGFQAAIAVEGGWRRVRRLDLAPP
jgi:4'-phosphopantetheinyl transferase